VKLIFRGDDGVGRLRRFSKRATRTRARRVTAVLVAVIAIVYVLAALAYARTVSLQEIPQVQAPPYGISVSIVESKISPEAPLTEAIVAMQPNQELIDSQGRMVKALRLSISPTLDGQSIEYAAGTVPASKKITIPLHGRVQDYPFDEYHSDITVAAYLYSEQVDQGQGRRVPVIAALSFRDAGWQLSATVKQTDSYFVTIGQTIGRAGSTIAISLLLLGLMMAVAVLAAWVAESVVSRAMEPSVAVASWMAALLFSLIPIRNFLPGAPPVGSWIDILVFFWVEVGVMTAMVAVVIVTLVDVRRKNDAEIEVEDRGGAVADTAVVGVGATAATGARGGAGSAAGTGPQPESDDEAIPPDDPGAG